MGVFRLLLAISVIVAHTTPIFGWTMMSGGEAVQTFFIISGFYMALILNEKYTAPGSYPLFLSNRLLRIFPVYWVVAGLTLVLYLAEYAWHGGGFIAHIHRPLDPPALLLLLFTNVFILGQEMLSFLGVDASGHLFPTRTYLMSDPPLRTFMLVQPAWTLSVELVFYVIAPWLLRCRTNEIAGVMFVSLALRWWIYFHFGLTYDPWTYRFFPNEVALFLAGALAYRIHLWLKRRKISSGLLMLVGAISLGIVICHQFLPNPSCWGVSVRQWSFYAFAIIMVPVLFAVSGNNRVDRYIGELSYPVYISHMLVDHVLTPPLLRYEAGAFWGLAVTVGSILFSVVLLRYVVSPIERIRQRRVSESGLVPGRRGPD